MSYQVEDMSSKVAGRSLVVDGLAQILQPAIGASPLSSDTHEAFVLSRGRF